MAKKKSARSTNTKLHEAAVQIGTALGKATRAARAAGESGPKAKQEFAAMKKSLNNLAKELEAAAARVKKALR